MRRLIPYLIGLASCSALVLFATAPGCGNECNKAEDCKPGNICYRNICTPNSAMYVHCTTKRDCGTTGEFDCVAARCVLPDVQPMGGGDAGRQDATMDATSPVDTGQLDAMPMDAMPADTSTIAHG